MAQQSTLSYSSHKIKIIIKKKQENKVILSQHKSNVYIYIFTFTYIKKFQEVECGYVDWIGLAQDRDRWRTLVIAVMNLRVP